MNERAIYEQIRLLGTVSRPQLAAVTGLSKPTVSLALASLERSGLVRSVGHRTGNAGRAAQLYEIRPDAGRVIGIDVGRGWVRAALADLTGTVTARRDVRSAARSASTLIDRLGELISELVAEAGGDVTYVVLGTPGVYDAELRRLLLAPNLPGWSRPGVIDRLAVHLPAPYTIENDAALAALGEQAYGLGAGVDDFVFVSIGTGIGMGVVVGGRLHRGARRAAGEISFLPVGECDPRAGAAGSRRHGMLETVASGPGVVATAQRLGMTGRITAKRVFDAARAGDPVARAAVDQEAGFVARALASVIAVLDPDLIVIGGGIGGHAADMLFGAVHDQLEAMTPLGPPRIEASVLGDDAVVLGALATGLSAARDIVLDTALGRPGP
ncbi:MAG TPA: ROK family protein [Streptosporangiaceae bacterium]